MSGATVADWLHRTVGGLAPAAPGYRCIRIAPVPGGGLSWASSRHRTPCGLAEWSWRIDDGSIGLDALVPPNTAAEVVLAGMAADRDPIRVGSGRHHWRVPDPTAGHDRRPAPRGGFSLAAHHQRS
jgi:alpha-L-rhamnosidase